MAWRGVARARAEGDGGAHPSSSASIITATTSFFDSLTPRLPIADWSSASSILPLPSCVGHLHKLFGDLFVGHFRALLFHHGAKLFPIVVGVVARTSVDITPVTCRAAWGYLAHESYDAKHIEWKIGRLYPYQSIALLAVP